MPVFAQWDNPDRTIYRFTLTGRWSLAELKEVQTRYKYDLAQVGWKVVSLVDMRHARLTPSGNLFDAGVMVFSERVINEDIIVVISSSRLLRQTATTFIGILKTLYLDRGLTTFWASSEAEAYRLIDDHWHNTR